MLVMAACTRGPRGTTANDHREAAPAHADPAASADTAGAIQTAVPVISDHAEAKAAIGKRVRVRGVARREKLGDSVSSPSFTVVCLEPRFPHARLDQPIVVEGLLELTDAFQATIGSDGSISQGTMPGTSTFVMRACTVL
jgi:hypothetical protein